MPSIASHFVSAKIISKELSIHSDEFYKGCILPDIIKLQDSHYKIRGTYYLIPNIDKYKENSIQSDLNKGYLAHLLLDKYFLEEYIPSNISNYKEINLFSIDKIYSDYSILNGLLINKYNLDLKYINRIMKTYDVNLDEKKFNNNLNHINNLEIGELNFINFNTYTKFLENISIVIAKELKEMEYGTINNGMSVCLRYKKK